MKLSLSLCFPVEACPLNILRVLLLISFIVYLWKTCLIYSNDRKYPDSFTCYTFYCNAGSFFSINLQNILEMFLLFHELFCVDLLFSVQQA